MSCQFINILIHKHHISNKNKEQEQEQESSKLFLKRLKQKRSSNVFTNSVKIGCRNTKIKFVESISLKGEELGSIYNTSTPLSSVILAGPNNSNTDTDDEESDCSSTYLEEEEEEEEDSEDEEVEVSGSSIPINRRGTSGSVGLNLIFDGLFITDERAEGGLDLINSVDEDAQFIPTASPRVL